MAKVKTAFMIEQSYPSFESWRPAIATKFSAINDYIRLIADYAGCQHVYFDQTGWDREYPEYVFRVYKQAPDVNTSPLLEFRVRTIQVI